MPNPLTPKRWQSTFLFAEADLESFVAANAVAAIRFDTLWDASGVASIQHRLEDAESAFGDRVAFGFVDCGRSPELAKALGILNIPAVAYYRDRKLVATLIGSRQNVRLRLERLLRGEAVGYKDGADL